MAISQSSRVLLISTRLLRKFGMRGIKSGIANINTIAAFFPIMFELTILLSGFTVLFGLLGLMGLPRLNHPLFNSRQFNRVTDDGFFIAIEARDPNFETSGTKELLEAAGGKNLELVEEDED